MRLKAKVRIVLFVLFVEKTAFDRQSKAVLFYLGNRN